MWKLYHRLFGWDYIAWVNMSDQGVGRVRVSPDGRVFYWRYRSTDVWDVVRAPKDVLWLTCAPSKYFPEDAQLTHSTAKGDS